MHCALDIRSEPSVAARPCSLVLTCDETPFLTIQVLHELPNNGGDRRPFLKADRAISHLFPRRIISTDGPPLLRRVSEANRYRPVIIGRLPNSYEPNERVPHDSCRVTFLTCATNSAEKKLSRSSTSMAASVTIPLRLLISSFSWFHDNEK